MAKFRSTDKKSVRRREDSDAHVDALYETTCDGGDPADLRREDGVHRQGPDHDRVASFESDHLSALMGPDAWKLRRD